ncbi:pumilio homolog 3-like [Saccostrea cucullata]|uniref:pumilio homolog 3-like n=1 Tax=Saccostrea cuccullata TaxID=36930 RepID=UPI002ED52A73
MQYKMEDSSFEEEPTRTKRRPPRSKNRKQTSMRGNPEGDSLYHKPPTKIRAPPNTDNDDSFEAQSPRKRKKKVEQDNIEVIEKKHMVKKKKSMYSDTDLSSLDVTDTPDTLSQISAIAPVSDVSMMTTFRNPRGRHDMTWEKAVQKARGQPDGAERSFNRKKSSKLVLQNRPEVIREVAEGVESDKSVENIPAVANIPEEEPQPLERRKSMKVKIKRAASNAAGKLRTLKTKKQLHESRTTLGARKKRLDESQMEEKSESRKTKLKELPFKERKKVRKMLKNNFEAIQRSKKIWENLRRQDVPEKEKVAMCNELLEMVKGNMKEFAFAHDTARVLQCLIQYGSPEQREIVFQEIKDQIVLMSKSKYAKFLVKKFLIYGSKPMKNAVIKSFHGSVRKLVRHAEASEVVELAYNDYANASQRLSLLEDFYGPSFTLFKTPDIKSLDQLLLVQPDKKEMILSNMKEALLPLIDKTILGHSMVHKIFHEFFVHAKEKMKSDMIESLREHLVHMIHTREGARAAMCCLWYGTSKDRKVIMKSFKTHVAKICKDEYGYLVLIALFDVVDDTKLVGKIILEEIFKNLHDIGQNQHGRKVLQYLLCPRDPHFFQPDIVRVLKEGDSNPHSKKDSALRYRELLTMVSQPFLQFIVDHARDLVLENGSLLLILSILNYSLGDPSDAMRAVAEIAAEPFVAGSLENQHIVEHPAGHMTLKHLIQRDRDRIHAGQSVLFSQVLLRTLKEGSLKSWAACNRGCFTLLFLLEVDHPEITDTVISQLSGIRSSLKKMTFRGAQLLLQKLDALSGEYKL